MPRRLTTFRYLPLEYPVLLIAVALVLLLGFQTWRLLDARAALTDARLIGLHQAQAGKGVRAQLAKLADGTARLAAGGDENAKAVMAEMQRLGVTLHQKRK